MTSLLFHKDADEQALSKLWTRRIARGTRTMSVEDKIRAFHALLPDALQNILRSVARHTRTESVVRGMFPVISLVFADEASLGRALRALAALRAKVAQSHAFRVDEALVELCDASIFGTMDYTETKRLPENHCGSHPAGVSVSLGSTSPMIASVSVEAFVKCELCEERGKLKVCNGCWNVSYCSFECSARNWAAHKNKCRKHARLTAALGARVVV
jgi:hypothetical protein